MFQQSRFAAAALFITLGAAGLMAPPAGANGDIGEHVNELKAHLDEYSQEIEWFTGKVDGLVTRYEDSGQKKVDTQKLIDWWEAVKVHGAIEVHQVPIYASIWQGIYGVKEGIEKGKPASHVREQQRALESALWQGLGAVKLAADQQKKHNKKTPGKAADRKKGGTIGEILGNLENVIALHEEGKHDKAENVVHGTYANLFEGIEGELIEQDADLVADLEKDFNVTLPNALDPETPVKEVRDIVAAMKSKLGKADKLLTRARENKKDVF